MNQDIKQLILYNISKITFSQNNVIIFDYKINDNSFHAFMKEDYNYINVIFIEYGYNQLLYFVKEYKFLNNCATFVKGYNVDNKL